MTMVKLHSNRDGNRSVEFVVQFVESSQTILFDVFTKNHTECMNVSLDNARLLADALNDAITQAEEAQKHTTVGSNLTLVKRDGVTYLFHPDMLNNFDVKSATDVELASYADVVIEGSFKVKKNRY